MGDTKKDLITLVGRHKVELSMNGGPVLETGETQQKPYTRKSTIAIMYITLGSNVG
jgi:hypothetical protein